MASAAPQSMTGFASGSQDTPLGRIAVEFKSVNSRFLDLAVRLHDELRAAEPALRELTGRAVRRGKVEIRVALQRAQAHAEPPALDDAALARLAQWQAAVRQVLPQAGALTVADCLRWPGVLHETAPDAEAMLPQLLALARAVADDFVASRQREGARCVEAIAQALDAIDATVRDLSASAPQLVAAQQARLAQRLHEALTDTAGAALAADETAARVRQEITAHGLRADVAEELARLAAHLAEARRAIAAGGPLGKRLDFLAQEFNREANTLGSKAATLELSRASVELKLLIEQVREQAQNLE